MFATQHPVMTVTTAIEAGQTVSRTEISEAGRRGVSWATLVLVAVGVLWE